MLYALAIFLWLAITWGMCLVMPMMEGAPVVFDCFGGAIALLSTLCLVDLIRNG